MQNDKIDLSPIDTLADALLHERLARRIVAGAADELERRAGLMSPIGVIAGWSIPALSAVIIVAVMAIGTLVTVERVSAAPDGSVPEALRLPAPVVAWLNEDRAPSNSDMIYAVEGGLP